MSKTNRWMMLAGVAAMTCLGAGNVVFAQDAAAGAPQDQQGRPGRGGGFGGDPAQFKQMMLDRYRDQLEVTKDDEWKALEPLVQKVMDARMQGFAGMGRGMFGGRGGRGGGPGSDPNAPADPAGRRNRGGFGGEPSPEADALQKAIDGKASNSEMKAALAKYQESRKVKQAELEKAQAELRGVLSVRQEAIATMSGLL